MPTPLEDLYESLRSASDLTQLLGQREHQYLEFKAKADPRKPDLDDYDRKNFSKELSAFANATGGVLL